MKKIISTLLFTVITVSISLAQPPEGLKLGTQEQHLKQLADRFAKELGLSEDQKQKLLKAYENFFSKLHQSAGKEMSEQILPPPPPPVSKEVMDKLVEERNSQLKSFLSEEQFQKLERLEKNKHNGKAIPPPPPPAPAAPGTPPPPPVPATPGTPATPPTLGTPPTPPTPPVEEPAAEYV